MATSITTRQTAGTGATVKGSPLSNTEVDNNFIGLNQAVQPTGGTVGQILVKIDSTDFNSQWSTIASVLGYTPMNVFNGASTASYDTLLTNGVWREQGGTNGPNGAAHSTLITALQSDGNYGYQLASDSSKLYVRDKQTSWAAWRTLLDSSNYNSYAPTLTGTGASGTWNISINGSVTAGADQAIINEHSGTGAAWYGRILSKNAGADRAAFIGTYGPGSVAGVFAHNHALNAWAPLYVNTVDGSSGAAVYMPSTTYINGSLAIHAGNFNTYSDDGAY